MDAVLCVAGGVFPSQQSYRFCWVTLLFEKITALVLENPRSHEAAFDLTLLPQRNALGCNMSKIEKTIETITAKFLDNWVVSIGVSGKDSLCVAHCSVEALKRASEINPNAGPLYLVTTDTTLDNFEIMNFLREVHQEAVAYGMEHGIDIQSRFLSPTLNSTPLVEYIGRGKLLRTPQTSTGGRDCAVNWKIQPFQRFASELKEVYQTDRILNMSGVRSDESAVRAANIEKRQESIDVVSKTEMGYTLAPIKDWTLNDVWSLIGAIDNGDVDSFAEDVADDIRKHYAAGNSGTCDLFAGKAAKSKEKACGARFGCFLCSFSNRDKSLEAQIETSPRTYGYMQGLNDLRTFMNNTLFDMERSRSLVGREVKDDEWVKIGWNQYSLAYRQELLRYALTLDAIERERGEDLGQEPKFQLIGPDTLMAIQYYWSREGGEHTGGTALQMWHDVHTEGKRYAIPATQPSDTYEHSDDLPYQYLSGDKVQSQYRYLNLSELNAQAKNIEMPGLGLYKGEEAPFTQHRVEVEAGKFEPIVPVHLAERFTIDVADAERYIEDRFLDLRELGACKPWSPMMALRDEQPVDPTFFLKDMMQFGVVKVRKGELKRIHSEAKRAQLLNVFVRTGKYADAVYLAYSVTEEEYKEQQQAKQKESDDLQFGLFAA